MMDVEKARLVSVRMKKEKPWDREEFFGINCVIIKLQGLLSLMQENNEKERFCNIKPCDSWAFESMRV